MPYHTNVKRMYTVTQGDVTATAKPAAVNPAVNPAVPAAKPAAAKPAAAKPAAVNPAAVVPAATVKPAAVAVPAAKPAANNSDNLQASKRLRQKSSNVRRYQPKKPVFTVGAPNALSNNAELTKLVNEHANTLFDLTKEKEQMLAKFKEKFREKKEEIANLNKNLNRLEEKVKTEIKSGRNRDDIVMTLMEEYEDLKKMFFYSYEKEKVKQQIELQEIANMFESTNVMYREQIRLLENEKRGLENRSHEQDMHIQDVQSRLDDCNSRELETLLSEFKETNDDDSIDDLTSRFNRLAKTLVGLSGGE